MRFDLAAHARAIERDGYTLIEDFMDAARLAEVRRVVGFYLGSHTGRNPFEGHSTERVYTLVARGRVFWDIALDERVLALCDYFLLPGCLLTASQAICIRPGDSRQALHHDDTFYTVPRPRPMISLSTIAAVDAFAAENGGTEILPGSHLWGEDWRDRAASRHGSRSPCPRAPASCSPGPWCTAAGRTARLRRGSRSPTSTASPGRASRRTFMHGVPLEVARQMPPRLQEMLGYSIYPPFMGQLTASHPAKLLEPAFENRVEAQASAAGARLPE